MGRKVLVLYILACLAVTISTVSGEQSRETFTTAPSGEIDAAEIVQGPWGILKISPAAVVAPEALVNVARTPDQTPVWRFPGADLAAVREIFAFAALKENEIHDLLELGNVSSENGGITLLPSVETLLRMSAASRHTIYTALAQNGGNPYHQYPLLISG